MPKSPPLELEGLSSGSQTSQTSTRAQRRAHVPASILQNLKLAAGDFVILRPSLTVQNLDGVSVEDKDEHRAIGESWILAQAWPSFSSNSSAPTSAMLLIS